MRIAAAFLEAVSHSNWICVQIALASRSDAPRVRCRGHLRLRWRTNDELFGVGASRRANKLGLFRPRGSVTDIDGGLVSFGRLVACGPSPIFPQAGVNDEPRVSSITE